MLKPWKVFSRIPFVVALATFVAPALFHAPAVPAAIALEWPKGTSIEKVEDRTIFFKAPEGKTPPPPLKTKLYDIETHDLLEPANQEGLPFVLLSALPCNGCKKKKTVYMIRVDGQYPSTYVYPGKIRDPRSGSLLYEGQAFYGKCVPGKGDVLVVFQQEKVDRRRYLQKSVFLAEAKDGRMDESLIVRRRRPSLNAAKRAVKSKRCRELSGFTRYMARGDNLDIPELHPEE